MSPFFAHGGKGLSLSGIGLLSPANVRASLMIPFLARWVRGPWSDRPRRGQ